MPIWKVNFQIQTFLRGSVFFSSLYGLLQTRKKFKGFMKSLLFC
ncbi:hypothetical protein CLOBOL_01611 [Enterocloster bolteae ATCC BAA-613]|uniref:Uncharacterized protein n=1 Tax=Enterocloster bolteae (strain ATCC BAA-613 / DSM 15670 / CCUG 46953 / JCM 12243 / WAL 16351) TaxID=411902 RepID=A8RLG3_ENTBW|nr:hypothetical protein CLOBOL_01611 [Enterocloster bolteae ATCC BAA-613]